MINNKPLTDEQKDAIFSLITDLKYEYEGPMDAESIESWVDSWIERES